MSQRRSKPPGGQGPHDGSGRASRDGPHNRRAAHRAPGGVNPPPNALFAEMLKAARELLAVRSPLDAELMVSEILGTWWGQRLRPGRQDSQGTRRRSGADIEELVGEGLVAYAARQNNPAALALLAGIACLGTTRQAAQAEQAALELMDRGVSRPRWADHVGKVAPGDCYVNRDTYGDRDEVVCVFSYAGEERHALVAAVDYNFGGMLRDGWVTSQVDKLLERGRAAARAEDAAGTRLGSFEPLPPGQARRMLDAALTQTDRGVSPPVSDSFPAYHAFIRARIRTLPPGRPVAGAIPGAPGLVAGPAAPRRLAWSKDRRAMLAAEFLASDEAEDLSDRRAASRCADRIIDYGCDQDFRRPLRMSPSKVERFLLDWLPRKVVLTPEEQEAVPHVLAAWTRWAGRRSGMRASAITATLDAVFESIGTFASTYRDPESFGLDRELINRLLPDGDLEALARRTFAFPLLAGRYGGLDLAGLDPADPADRRKLLAADHGTGSQPGEGRHGAHSDTDTHLDRHVALADRLWRGAPPELWDAAQRLLDLGTERHEALHVLMETLDEAGPGEDDIAAALGDLPPDT
ncbi:MAG TPA: hypothetical protein VKD26_15445 [Streptosporangiaceae bacterium]|nr:hypothetical protein [Streptosporangiaceae bacterium]